MVIPPEVLYPFLSALVLAVIGYFAAYLNNLRLDKRKEKLDLINRQINQFYGPLFVSVNTSDVAYKAYLRKIENRKSIDTGVAFTEYERKNGKPGLRAFSCR